MEGDDDDDNDDDNDVAVNYHNDNNDDGLHANETHRLFSVDCGTNMVHIFVLFVTAKLFFS